MADQNCTNCRHWDRDTETCRAHPPSLAATYGMRFTPIKREQATEQSCSEWKQRPSA